MANLGETHADKPRFRSPQGDLVPRSMVRLIGALMLACLVLVTYSVATGRPLESTPPVSEVVQERLLVLVGEMSGAARVLDENGALIAEYSAEKGGFIAGVSRVIERERGKARVALDGPVRLVRMENGRLALSDPSTGWSADLMGFGADNSAAFAKLLD